jgi:hypothetical protein
MAIGTVIAVWQLLLPHTTTPITQRSEGSLSPNIFDNKGSIIIQGDIGQKPSQNLIDAQCVPKMLITTPLSPGETIEALPLWHMPAANGGGGLDQLYIEKGNEFIWPKPKPEAFPTLKGYECKITNYTTDPVFNVWIEL